MILINCHVFFYSCYLIFAKILYTLYYIKSAKKKVPHVTWAWQYHVCVMVMSVWVADYSIHLCVSVSVGCLGDAQAHGTQRRVWIINTPLAADGRAPASSRLTFMRPVSLKFYLTHMRVLHYPHLQCSSAWSHDELVSLDRYTFPWHWRHAASHLIYIPSRGTRAALTYLIFPVPCNYRHSEQAQTCCHFEVPHRSFPSSLILLRILIEIFQSVSQLAIHYCHATAL